MKRKYEIERAPAPSFSGFSVKVEPKKKTKSCTIEERQLNTFKQSILYVSEEEHARIVNLEQHFDDAEQTTNPEWLDARTHRVTGSAVANVVHVNPYEGKLVYLKSKLWPQEMDERGKQNCRYGNLNEPVAEQCFEAYMMLQIGELTNDDDGAILDGVEVTNLGLYICKKPSYGCLGMSPDGILTMTWKRADGSTYTTQDLIEYKCPSSWKKLIQRGDGHMYKMEYLPPNRHVSLGGGPVPGSLPRKWYPCPPYYFTQVQYGMELFRISGMPLRQAYFVVWSPSETEVTVIPRDQAYGNFLVEEAKKFWTDLYAPRYLLKQNGQLCENEIDVSITIE